MRPSVVLVGDGVQARAAFLARTLDPRWELVSYREGGDARDAVRLAVAAVGMPDAVKWNVVTSHLRLLQVPGAGLDGLDPANLPRGCEVCNVYEHEASVAEYIFGALMRVQSRA